MRRTDSDLLRIPDRELDRLSEDELLRLVVITRDGNRKAADKGKQAWAMLAATDIDRIRGIVDAFRFPGQAGVQVRRSEIDRVTQNAYIRLLGVAFRGQSIGEYRAAMRSCVRFECMDDCRREMGEDMRRAGSLDDEIPTDEGDSRARFDKEIAKLERERIDDEEAAARGEELRDRITAAISRIENDNQRKVVEMTRDGRSTEQIMAELDTSRDNVYQLRRRGLKRLQEILDGD